MKKSAQQMLMESLKIAGVKNPQMPKTVGIDAYQYVSESKEFHHSGSQLVVEAALMESVFGKIANFFKSDYKDVKYAFFANATGDVITVVGKSGKFEVVEILKGKAKANKFNNSMDLTRFLAVKIAQGFELKRKQLDIKGVMKQIGKGLLAVMGLIAFGFGAYYLVSAYGAAALAMGMKVPVFLSGIMDKITGGEADMVTKELPLPPQVTASLTDAEAKVMDAKDKALDFLRQQEQAVQAVARQNDANEKSGIGQLAVGVGKSKEELEALYKTGRVTAPFTSTNPETKMRDGFTDATLSGNYALATIMSPFAAAEAAVKNVQYAIDTNLGADDRTNELFKKDDQLSKLINTIKSQSGDSASQVTANVKKLVSLLDDKAKAYQEFLQNQVPSTGVPVTTVRFDTAEDAVKEVAKNVTDTQWISRIASDAVKIATMISREQAMRNDGKAVTPNTTLDDVLTGP